ncbi:MAG: class I SAM-dependent methyltransferase [Patescibacteria group bacterium]|jgi:SAM-dependent methyltransferase
MLESKGEGGQQFKAPEEEGKKESSFFDAPMDEKVGALKTTYLKDLAELVTGEAVPELTKEEDPNAYEIDHHYAKDEIIAEYFSRLMKDKVVLDLGCGVQTTGYKIANFSHAKEYIGVEKHFGKSAFEKTAETAAGESTPFQIVQQDMVEYVQDQSHSADVIFLVGVDLIIIPENEWERLLQGIHQTLTEDGRLLIGGGMGKPWQTIEKYFVQDASLDEVKAKPEYMLTWIPSVWKKRMHSQ